MHKRKHSTIIEVRPNTDLRPLSKPAEFTIIIVNYNEHTFSRLKKNT